MKIKMLHLIEGARHATGLTVIIDVFRAFSLACYLSAQGAKRIIPVGDIEFAYGLKKKNSGFILIGERNNKKMPGFDFGNSPFEVRGQDFTGKTIVHTTSAGTQGIANASKADEIITGSFVNAGAIVKYIRTVNPQDVSLVCMGYSANHPVEEDTLCAEYIRSVLENKPVDFSEIRKTIGNTSGKRFFNPETQEHCPAEDFHMCLDLNRFNFVLKAEKDTSGFTKLKRIEIS